MVGATYAWFSDSTEIAENRFIVEIPEPGTESAWVLGDNRFNNNPNQLYFEYEIGDGSAPPNGVPIERDIFIGQEFDVIGKVIVWDENDMLYIKYVMTEGDVKIESALLYAKLTVPNFTGVGNNYETADESFTWPGVTEYTFVLSQVNGTLINNITSSVYITGKLDVYDNR